MPRAAGRDELMPRPLEINRGLFIRVISSSQPLHEPASRDGSTSARAEVLEDQIAQPLLERSHGGVRKRSGSLTMPGLRDLFQQLIHFTKSTPL